MLPYFVLGVALLIGGMLAARWFVTADPKLLVKVVKWGIFVVLVGLVVVFLTIGRMAWAFAALPVLLLWMGRFRAVARLFKNVSRMSAASRGAPPQGSSEVETRYLRMSLDHATGAMDGEVIEGSYAGQRVGDMSVHELVDLLKTCWIEDEQSAQVLESYLDRVHGEWREQAQDQEQAQGQAQGQAQARARARAGGNGAGAAGEGPMSSEEAYKVLGLEPGAGTSDIKEAHRRLMAGLHPDHGGSNYLAAKINQAKDLLTGDH